jgi:hypothetical protein
MAAEEAEEAARHGDRGGKPQAMTATIIMTLR